MNLRPTAMKLFWVSLFITSVKVARAKGTRGALSFLFGSGEEGGDHHPLGDFGFPGAEGDGDETRPLPELIDFVPGDLDLSDLLENFDLPFDIDDLESLKNFTIDFQTFDWQSLPFDLDGFDWENLPFGQSQFDGQLSEFIAAIKELGIGYIGKDIKEFLTDSSIMKNLTCIPVANELTCTLPSIQGGNEPRSGTWVCRTFHHPMTGEPARTSACVDEEYALFSDECGCCGGICPEDCPCGCGDEGGVLVKSAYGNMVEPESSLCIPHIAARFLVEAVNEVTCDESCIMTQTSSTAETPTP